MAARAGQADVVRYLLKNGAKVETKSKVRTPSLIINHCVGKKKSNNDEILGQKSLSPSPQDDQTALHISSRLGKVDIVQQLLQCGASANAATTSGYTPLHLAAREGHQDVAAMLLENGASLSSSTKVGQVEDLISCFFHMTSHILKGRHTHLKSQASQSRSSSLFQCHVSPLVGTSLCFQ